ncbi:hypothetical protein [Nocardia sp. NPDC004260]
MTAERGETDTARPWTVGQFRDALAAFPPELPLVAMVPADGADDEYVDEFAVTGAPERGTIDWGDGRGEVLDAAVVFEALLGYRRTRPAPDAP